MNVYDGERMAELMAAQGMTATDDANAADLVVLNTCHIREKATEKVYSDIGRHAEARRAAPDDRGRRLRRAGRGRGDRRAAPRSTSSSARRPITTCPIWSPRRRAASAALDTDMPVAVEVRRAPRPPQGRAVARS